MRLNYAQCVTVDQRVQEASNDGRDGFAFALYTPPCQKYGELDRSLEGAYACR